MAKWIRITGARITGARYWEHGFNPLLDGGNGGDCAACKNTAILLISAELQGARLQGARI